MRCTPFLVALLCILKRIGPAHASCTTDNNYGGIGNRLQCTNTTLKVISNQTADASVLMIFNSDLSLVTERAFAKYARYLQSLIINYCRVSDIHADAFDTLASLKKLGLPNNNLTRVKEEWFKDLVYLEQLDLSFNQIMVIQPAVFDRLPLLKRLDVRENRLFCLNYSRLPGGIERVYVVGNPLSFMCRGKLTLWMRDHGVSYKTEMSEKEAWLDKLLWLCAMGDDSVGKSEVLMKECVILNLFNQLRTGLSTAESYPLKENCSAERNSLTNCIAAESRKFQTLTNGDAMKKLLLYLHQSKSIV